MAMMVANPKAQLVYCPHPLLPARGRQLFMAPILPGESVMAYLLRHQLPTDEALELVLEGEHITRAEWATRYPQPGQIISLRRVVQGGGGSNPLRTILTLSVLVFTPWAATALAGSMSITSSLAIHAIQAGVGIAGMLVVNALVPPTQPTLPQLSEEADPQRYAISGGGNRARPYAPLPLVLGRHRLFPDLAAREYTEFEGDEQYLYQLYHWGLGDIVVNDLRIGDTALDYFDGVSQQWSDTDGRITLVPGNVDTVEGAVLDDNAWVIRTGSINTSRLAVDIAGQLFRAGDEGLEALSATIAIGYRIVGESIWQTHTQTVLRHRHRTPIRRTFSWTTPPGHYEVRVRRVSAPETNSRNTSELQWAVLRSYQADTADYTGQRRLGLKIRASGQLQGRVDRLSGLASSRVPVWDGGQWTTQETSNPAWLFLYFARGLSIQGRLVAGCGLSDARIDIEGLKLWAAFCDREGLACNLVLSAQRSRAEVLTLIARCGRAAPTWQTGHLGVVWDEAGRPVTAAFGMSNIIAGSFRVEWATEALADEIVLRYIDPESDWQEETVRVLLPGVTAPQRSVELNIEGITSRQQASAEAHLQAARQRLHRTRYSFEVSMEGLAVERGDVVLLSHDMTQWSWSGRVLAGSTVDEVLLSRELPDIIGTNHYLVVQYLDGSMETRTVASVEGARVQLAEPLPRPPDTEARWYFDSGSSNGVGKKVKIIDYEPVGAHSVRLAAIDEVDEYYAATTNTTIHRHIVSVHYPPVVHQILVSEELVRIGQGYGVQLYIDCIVSGDWREGVVYIAHDGGAESLIATMSGTTRATWQAPSSGTLDIRVQPGSRLVEQGRGLTRSYTLIGHTAVPGTVRGFRVSTQADGTRVFAWNAAAEVDVIGYEISVALGTGRTIDELAPLHDGLLTQSPWETNQLAAGIYTAAIIAVDSSGQRSVPTVIESTLGDPRIPDTLYYQQAELLGWPGTRTNCVLDDTTPILVGNLSYDWGAPGTFEDWSAWNAHAGAMTAGLTMQYGDTIDLGVVSECTPLITPVSTGGVPLIELRSSDDGINWSSWQAPPSTLSARYIEYRISLSSSHDSLPTLTALTVLISADMGEELINDADTATWQGSAATGRIIPTRKSFTAIAQIQLALQDVGAGWSWEVLSKDAETPTIRIYDNARQAADATVDVLLRGVT